MQGRPPGLCPGAVHGPPQCWKPGTQPLHSNPVDSLLQAWVDRRSSPLGDVEVEHSSLAAVSLGSGNTPQGAGPLVGPPKGRRWNLALQSPG